MKVKLLMTAVSMVALMSAVPAMADTTDNKTTINSRSETAQPAGTNVDKPPMTKAEAQKDWKETKQAVKETYESFKASVINEDPKLRAEPVTLETRTSASGILGKPVVNQADDKVATVEDIILDKEGNARLIVVKDGGFAGMGGKMAAFDYEGVIDRTADGDVIMPITEKTIDTVSEFSYKTADAKSGVRVIPENGYSVKKLLDGNLVGPNGKKIAAIDNITLRNGKADLVIAAYNQVLNMGGDNVAINFDATKLVRTKNDVDLKLSESQTRQFESFKKSAAK